MSECATPGCNNLRQRRHQHCAACVAKAEESQPAEFQKLKARLLGVMEREDRRGLYDRTGKKPRA
jgi:hypothetical protein